MSLWYQAMLLGTGFGLLHAFDGDHLATIGGLAINDRSLSPTAYALRWALGHGVALGLVGTAVLGLDLAGIGAWMAYGEWLVCLALVVIGLQALRAVWRRLPPGLARTTGAKPRAELRAHLHDGPRPHLHFFAPWHSHARAGRASLAMGLVHGGAGSAAVLALLPLAHFRSGVESALYLLCFSAGVALGALAFAQAFALLARRTAAAGERLAAVFQGAVGVLAIASGAWLFLEITHGGR